MSERMVASAAAIDIAVATGETLPATQHAGPPRLPALNDDLSAPMSERSFLCIVTGVAAIEVAVVVWVTLRFLFAGP